MMGRVGCTFAALLGVALVSEMLFLGDFSDVIECNDVSAGYSWIYDILHVREKYISCVSGEIRIMFFYRS